MFSKEVLSEAAEIKEKLEALREKIRSSHNPAPDKSFLKGKLSAYEKFLPEINVDGLKKQLEQDE